MEDDNDFTFCQVGLETDEDHLESPKTIPNIASIMIKDGDLTGPSCNTVNNSLQEHNSSYDATSTKSGTDCSLNFKVIHRPLPKFKAGVSLQRCLGDSVHGSMQKKDVTEKSTTRSKFLFEKGFSQMDWLKIARTHPDLADDINTPRKNIRAEMGKQLTEIGIFAPVTGLRGQSNERLISMDEVKQHKTDGPIWTVLKGRIYNISPYLKFHPGGVDMLMKAAGKDCTSLFNKYHAWVNAEFLLENCLVGTLDDN